MLFAYPLLIIMRLLVLSAICALAFLSVVKADNPVGHPIAVVPGILGSSLHAFVPSLFFPFVS